MLPISQIHQGDQFQNPLFNDGVIFVVEEVVKEEKLVKVQGWSFIGLKPVGSPFWKKSSDRLFSESWRIN